MGGGAAGDDGEPLRDTFQVKYKGKKRQFKVAQINLMVLSDDGSKPVVSWLLQKIEGWEYDTKKQQLSLNVRDNDDGTATTHVLKLPEDEGRAALAVIDQNVQGLVAERKRQKNEQEALGDAGPEEKSGSGGSPRVVASEASSSDGAGTDKMMPCKVKGKKRQLKIAQMNLMLFDDSGTKPVESWLYEKLEGWEYDDKKNTLSLKVIGADDTELHELKMTWKEDAVLALDGIQANVQSLVAEKKRLRKEEKAKKAMQSADETDLQERINKALADSVKDTELISKVLADARTAKHIHPSVLSLQKKLSALEAASESEDEGQDDDSSDDEHQESDSEEDAGGSEPEYSTTEEEEEGELTLQDKIDDALEETFTDVAAMKALLKEAHAARHVHPSVISLGNKIETLEAEEDEFDEGGDTLGDLPASRPKKKMASTARRMSVAEEGVKGVIEEAAIASLGMEDVLAEKMFNVAFKKKKKEELQFKVGQMNCQLFDGPQMLGSWLYLSIHEWQYLPSSRIFDMTVPKVGGGGKTEKIELYSIDGVGEEIAELMTQHAQNIAKQMKKDKKAASSAAAAGQSPRSGFDGSATTFDCKYLGKKRQLKIGRRNIMVLQDSGSGPPVEVWDFEVKLKGWEWIAKKKLLKLNVLERSDGDKEIIVGVSMKQTDGEEALAAIDESIQALLVERKAAKQKSKMLKATSSDDSSQRQDDVGSGVGLDSDPAIVDLSTPERYKALAAGLIRTNVSVESAKAGTMEQGSIYLVTKKARVPTGERFFIGDGWVSPVARSGLQLLEKIHESSLEQHEASVRSYISLKGPDYQRPSVSARVIKALAAVDNDPKQWIPFLEDLNSSGELDEFLAACKLDAISGDEARESPGGISIVKTASQLEASDTDEETVDSSKDEQQTSTYTATSAKEASQTGSTSSSGSQEEQEEEEEERESNDDADSTANSDDWLISDAHEPAAFESSTTRSEEVRTFMSGSESKSANAFAPMAPEPEPEPEPDSSRMVEPIDINTDGTELTFSLIRDSDGAAVTLEVLARKIRLTVSGSRQDIPYQKIRSWWDVGNQVCFVLKSNASSGTDPGEEASIGLRCEEAHRASEIAQCVAAAVSAAASSLSPKSAAMLPSLSTLPAGSYQVWHADGSDMAEFVLSIAQDRIVISKPTDEGSADLSQVFREFPYKDLRSWAHSEDAITLTSQESSRGIDSPFILKSKDPAKIADAIAEAARVLSQQLMMAEADRVAAEALPAAAEKAVEAAAEKEMQRLQREKEQLQRDKEAEAAVLAEAAAEAKRAHEAEIAKIKSEMEAALQQQREEMAAAAAAASKEVDIADATAAHLEAQAEADARRSAEAAEIAELKAEIAAEHEAQVARSAALEQERNDALERTRQLERIAMSQGRAAEMDAKLQAEKKDEAATLAALEAEIKAETLATQQEEAAKQAALSASKASRLADATPNPSFEPVTGATPRGTAVALPTKHKASSELTTESSISSKAAALAEVPTPTPARVGELSPVALSDRQLALGQAALSTLTERLEEMHRKDPSMLSSARFDALCNTIGDYSQNPSSVALEDVVKTTVRLAGAFKSDAAFAKQLQRKVFASPVMTTGAAGAGGSTGTTVAAAEMTGNLVHSLQTEVATLRQEIMRLGNILQDPASPRLSPIPSREEDRRIDYGGTTDPTAVVQNLMESAEELQEPTEASAEASVRSLYEAQSAAEHKQRNADRSFAGRLLTLQAQLEKGLITDAQYSDERRRLSQLAASPERSPILPASSLDPMAPVSASPASAVARSSESVLRHANGAPRIKKDVARSLALACLLRQVSIGELLPVVRSHLGVASISELEELEPADLNTVSLSPLHRRRLLRALDFVKNVHVKDALLKGERLARSGDIQAAIQQCRHALTLGPAGGLAPSPTPREDEPAEAETADKRADYSEAGAGIVDRGVDGEVHDHNDPDSDFFCDATGRTLRLGAWWHRVGSSYDLCADEYHKLPHGSARSGFLLVSKLSDLGNDRQRYGHGRPGGEATLGNGRPEEGVPPPQLASSPLDPVRPPASRQLRQDIEKMAAYVMRHGGVGGDFDQIARRKQQNNPRFAFMFGGEGAEYYNYVTAELTRRLAQSAAQGLTTAHRKAAVAARPLATRTMT